MQGVLIFTHKILFSNAIGMMIGRLVLHIFAGHCITGYKDAETLHFVCKVQGCGTFR